MVSVGSRARATSSGRSPQANSPGTWDDAERGIREIGDHRLRLVDREELVLFAPHECDGHVDASVERAEVPYELVVEAAEQAHRRVALFSGAGQWLEEELAELAELAVEQRGVGEGVAEDE